MLNPFRISVLLLLLASCKPKEKGQAAQVPGPRTEPPNCVSFMNDQMCCDTGKSVIKKLIRNRADFEAMNGYELVKETIGPVDFRYEDLILLWPGDLPLSHKLSGTPTSSGMEWQIYKRMPAWCDGDTAKIVLQCSPTINSSTGFYWTLIPKARTETLRCGCGGTAGARLSLPKKDSL